MATRGVEPITLPWKRPEKGVSAAELGASFRVEQREDGWHCTVRVGRRAEVLATGLRRLRDAQCRAEAHAATLPEVAAALAKRNAEAAKEKGTAQVRTAGPVRAAKEPNVRDERRGPSVPRRTAAPTFEPLSDGCICGKIEGGTWIADPAGKVSVPAGTAPEVAQAICRVAAQHYAAQRGERAPTPERPRVAARAASRGAAKRKPAVEAEATQPATAVAPATPRHAGKGKRGKGRNRAARKRLAAKLAGKSVKRASRETADEVAAKITSKPRATRKAAAKKTPKTATTAKTPPPPKATTGRVASTAKTTTKTAKRAAKPAATAPLAAKSTARSAKTTAVKGAAKPAVQVTAKAVARAEDTTKAGKQSGRRREAGKKAPARAEKAEEPMGKKSGKASKDECGCMTWTEVDGKARGEARHGAFVIEPEGKKHALYFYDPEGQSRHLQSGDAAKLRSVAEEMAARGQPAVRAASAGDDAALLKMFMAGAMEEES